MVTTNFLSLPLRVVETRLITIFAFSKPNAISADDAILKADAERLDLLADNAQDGWRGASYNDAVVAFSSEKALMMPQGSWALAAINQQDPKFEVGMFASLEKK